MPRAKIREPTLTAKKPAMPTHNSQQVRLRVAADEVAAVQSEATVRGAACPDVARSTYLMRQDALHLHT